MIRFSFALLIILASSSHMAHAGQTGSTNKYQGPAVSAEEQDRLNTGLLEAAKDGHLFEINQALSQGAEVDAQDANGNTPLMVAIIFGHYDIAKALLEWGADANAQNDAYDTALTLLAQHGADNDFAAEQMVRLLVLQGDANPYQGNRNFELPVSIAKEQGNAGVTGELARLTNRMERLVLDDEMMEVEPRKKKRRTQPAITCGDEVFNLGNPNNDKDDDDFGGCERPFNFHSKAFNSVKWKPLS